MAELHIIVGPMCSGKTTELYRRLQTHALAHQKVLYINSSLDTRSDAPTSTHNPFLSLSTSEIVGIAQRKYTSLSDVDVSDFEVIGVDESQFFPDLLTVVGWVESLRKTVYVCGLDGDSYRNTFGETLRLVPYANTIVKLNGVCAKCAHRHQFSHAHFTWRQTRAHSFDGDQIEIGGTDKYTPLCRECWMRENA